MLRAICGPQRKEMRGGWRNQCSEDFHDCCRSLSIFKTIESVAGHVVHVVNINMRAEFGGKI